MPALGAGKGMLKALGGCAAADAAGRPPWSHGRPETSAVGGGPTRGDSGTRGRGGGASGAWSPATRRRATLTSQGAEGAPTAARLTSSTTCTAPTARHDGDGHGLVPPGEDASPPPPCSSSCSSAVSRGAPTTAPTMTPIPIGPCPARRGAAPGPSAPAMRRTRATRAARITSGYAADSATINTTRRALLGRQNSTCSVGLLGEAARVGAAATSLTRPTWPSCADRTCASAARNEYALARDSAPSSLRRPPRRGLVWLDSPRCRSAAAPEPWCRAVLVAPATVGLLRRCSCNGPPMSPAGDGWRCSTRTPSAPSGGGVAPRRQTAASAALSDSELHTAEAVRPASLGKAHLATP